MVWKWTCAELARGWRWEWSQQLWWSDNKHDDHNTRTTQKLEVQIQVSFVSYLHISTSRIVQMLLVSQNVQPCFFPYSFSFPALFVELHCKTSFDWSNSAISAQTNSMIPCLFCPSHSIHLLALFFLWMDFVFITEILISCVDIWATNANTRSMTLFFCYQLSRFPWPKSKTYFVDKCFSWHITLGCRLGNKGACQRKDRALMLKSCDDFLGWESLSVTIMSYIFHSALLRGKYELWLAEKGGFRDQENSIVPSNFV